MSDFKCNFLEDVSPGFKGNCFGDYSRFLQKELEAEEAQKMLMADLLQGPSAGGTKPSASLNFSQFMSLGEYDEYKFDENSAHAWSQDGLGLECLFNELHGDHGDVGDKQAAIFEPIDTQYPILAPVEHFCSDSDSDSDSVEDENDIQLIEAPARRTYSDKSPCWTKDDTLARRPPVYPASESEDETSDDDEEDEADEVEGGDGASDYSVCEYETYSDGDIEPFPLYVEPFPEVESASNVSDCFVSLSERVKLGRRGQKGTMSSEIKKKCLGKDEDLSDSDYGPKSPPALKQFKSQPTKKVLSTNKRDRDDDDDHSQPGCQSLAPKKARSHPTYRSSPSKKRSRDDLVEIDCDSVKPPRKKAKKPTEPYVFTKVIAKGPVFGRPSIRSLPFPPIVQPSLKVGARDWEYFECATLYYLLVEHRNMENREGLVPLKDEKLHRHMSNLMRTRYNVVRSPLGCRNWWNRHGRFETGWDERINGKGSLITSSQAKKSKKSAK